MFEPVATGDFTALAADIARQSGTPFKEVARNLIRDSAEQVQALASRYAPVKTGELKSSITIEYTDDGMVAEIFPQVDYARYQEFGTGTRGEFPGSMYVIKPKPPKKFLKFKGQGGQDVFVREVKHPGIPPRPFMRPAAERVALGLGSGLADAAVMFLVQTPSSGSNRAVTS